MTDTMTDELVTAAVERLTNRTAMYAATKPGQRDLRTIVAALASTPTVADDGKLVDEDAASDARNLRLAATFIEENDNASLSNGTAQGLAETLRRIATRLEQHGRVREALAAFADEYLPSGIRDTPKWNAVLAAAGVRTNG
jgi:hypothetical protein